MSLVFDIETAGYSREEILSSVPPFDPENVKLGNRKTPESIMDYMEKAEDDYYDRWVERAALDARTGIVLCIGLYNGGFGLLDEGGEKQIIGDFWALWKVRKPEAKFIGFNVLRFDLPFLVRRSWALGVPVPDDLWDGRYFNRAFIDLLSYWACGNRDEMISLEHLARFFGLPPKKGNGKGFSKLWQEDKPAAIEYLKTDLEIVTEAAQKMGLL